MSNPQDYPDPLSRINAIEANYKLNGTLSDEEITYLIGQAHSAMALDEAGEALADASITLVSSMSNVIKELSRKLEEKEQNNP